MPDDGGVFERQLNPIPYCNAWDMTGEPCKSKNCKICVAERWRREMRVVAFQLAFQRERSAVETFSPPVPSGAGRPGVPVRARGRLGWALARLGRVILDLPSRRREPDGAATKT